MAAAGFCHLRAVQAEEAVQEGANRVGLQPLSADFVNFGALW